MTKLDLSNTGILTEISKNSDINRLERFIRNQLKGSDAIEFIKEYAHMNIWLGKDIISTPAITSQPSSLHCHMIKKGFKPFIYHVTIDGTRYDRSIYTNK